MIAISLTIAFFATFEKPSRKAEYTSLFLFVRTLSDNVNGYAKPSVVQHRTDLIIKEFYRVPATQVSSDYALHAKGVLVCTIRIIAERDEIAEGQLWSVLNVRDEERLEVRNNRHTL